MSLADEIEKRIRVIPAHNTGYISITPSTLGRVLDGSLIRKIAEEAAAETHYETLIQALEFYANNMIDGGSMARRALEKFKGGGK